MPSRALNDLTPDFRAFAVELIARLVESGVAVMVVCTRRTQAEQDEALRTGHSQVRHSRHQDGDAIDLCPFQAWALHGADKLQWDTKDPVWRKMGAIGEALGLRWGGRFNETAAGAGDGFDPGHFELPRAR